MSPAARRHRPRIRIGCAGWSIPAAHRASFGKGDSVLERYATRFDLVEINSSFYRPHRRETYARWAATVPRGFRFTAKLPRTITHEQRLRGAGPALDRFLDECAGLGDKLDCLLLQLPPSLVLELRHASTCLAMLRRRWNGAVACEPRHASWFTPHADDLLKRHRIARVAADPPLHAGAGLPGGDTASAYWRWHGSPRVYYSAYGEAELGDRAAGMCALQQPGNTWVVFDNTAHGHAIADALRFQEFVR